MGRVAILLLPGLAAWLRSHRARERIADMRRMNHWRGQARGLCLKALGRVLNDPILVMRGEFDLLHARWESRGITGGRRHRPTLSQVAR